MFLIIIKRFTLPRVWHENKDLFRKVLNNIIKVFLLLMLLFCFFCTILTVWQAQPNLKSFFTYFYRENISYRKYFTMNCHNSFATYIWTSKKQNGALNQVQRNISATSTDDFNNHYSFQRVITSLTLFPERNKLFNQCYLS